MSYRKIDRAMYDLYLGDCLEVMRTLSACSLDAIVTDPPYGLAFMGNGWDHGVPGVDFWTEALRVAKPGAHLLAFGGTRTYHRLACAIEDAGWEIRDCVMWVYGSGFPKSHDMCKAIDKLAGHWRGKSPGIVSGNAAMSGGNYNRQPKGDAITAAAAAWSGWGTALKPAWEPIIVARKPLIGTVVENVLKHGTGAINVDGCRVGTDGGTTRSEQAPYAESGWRTGHEVVQLNAGRWPANLIHDGSKEVVGLFPEAAPAKVAHRGKGKGESNVYGVFGGNSTIRGHDDAGGSAARFFYTAKATAAERQGVTHPTVKPLDLMAYLCRLVTPPGGTVLDPFMGSGTTIKAAISEGFHGIGIERDEAYFAMAQHRLDGAQLGFRFIMEALDVVPKNEAGE